jgi:hypothetical protein
MGILERGTVKMSLLERSSHTRTKTIATRDLYVTSVGSGDEIRADLAEIFDVPFSAPAADRRGFLDGLAVEEEPEL